MSEAKDPAIKLFGCTIPLAEALQQLPSPATAAELPPEVGHEEVRAIENSNQSEKDPCKVVEDIEVNHVIAVAPNEGKESLQSSSSSLETINEDNHKTRIEGNKDTSDTNAENKAEPDGSVQDKVLKKPDKILPCPRCNSMDTKFCYYNNYNVNQPRHFCKNCQRYWTAGGTMRNVPVGAGRRKNKHSSSQYRHMVMPSDGMQPAQLNNADLANHQRLPCTSASSPRPLTSNDTVLKFGTEVPLCDSMASALNIREENRNGDYNSVACRENKEEPSSASSVTATNCLESGIAKNAINVEQSSMKGYHNGLTPLPHFQCYPGAPWAYPWPPGWNSIAAIAAGRCPSDFAGRLENLNQNPVPWMVPPAFCPPTVPFPLMPSSFWGCMPSWPNGAWTVPWSGANGAISPSSSTSNSGCSGNGSPTLGKHSRDATFRGEQKSEKSLWIPKTLRIDDPDEAAKSSIWATLGIKPEECRIFKPFQSKSESKVQTSDAAQVWHANPAALSRSQTFQEST